MHPSVSEAWPAFAAHFEGVCDFLYLDTRALVTTGIGFLMDEGTGHAPEACLKLPWIDQGVPATRTQIGSAWNFVKARTDLAPKGGFAFQSLTTVRLPAQAINALLTAKTLDFWSVLSAQLPGLEQWPADAQLALIDMGWHFGPHFLGPNWPNFTAAAHAEDFAGMATHCQTANRSPRDARHVRLFSNAAQVIELGIDPERLWDETTPVQEVDMAERIPFRGGLACSCVVESLPLVEEEMLLRGLIKESIDCFQFGYRDDVSSSAGTHARGYNTDVGQFNDAQIDIWRLHGWTMQHRTKAQGFDLEHGHGGPWGCPHGSPAALDQIAQWRNRQNGLVSHGPVQGRWPVKDYRDAMDERKKIIMALADDIAKKTVAEQIRRGPELGKAIAKGFLSADDIIASGQDEPDPKNQFQAAKTFVTNDHNLLVDIRAALKKLAPPTP